MNTETDLPLVSVAMPIYNEEKHLREALESIARQDYPNLEILISDNHSTDRTAAICKEFAKKNSRVSYHRNAENIGISPNFIYTFKKSNGKYFMWASGHDKWEPDCISNCIQSLEQEASANLALGTPIWIGEDGNILQKHSGWYDTRGLTPVARFFMVFWGSMNPMLGIFRKKDVPNLKCFNYAGADLTLLEVLALKGTFIHVTDTCLYRRQNRAVESHNERMNRYKGKEMKIAVSYFSRLFPLAKLPFDLLRAVLQSKITLIDKICIIALLLPSLPLRYIVGKKAGNSQQ